MSLRQFSSCCWDGCNVAGGGVGAAWPVGVCANAEAAKGRTSIDSANKTAETRPSVLNLTRSRFRMIFPTIAVPHAHLQRIESVEHYGKVQDATTSAWAPCGIALL